MSDFPNGNPPGQNNLDAGVERYVAVENDPSAGAHKPDEDRPKEDGIEPKPPTDPEVQKELDQAAKNVVEPSSAEEQEEEQKPQAQSKFGQSKADPNETKDTKPGGAASGVAPQRK